MKSSDLLQEFKSYYQAFDQRGINQLDSLYSDEVVFTDPIHTISGLDNLKRYFHDMCANLTQCHFEFLDEMEADGRACFKWVMHYRHPSVARNKPLQLMGVSVIAFDDDKVTSHEDFYDMGAMLYERLPVLGSAIRMVKSRAAGGQ